MNRSLIITVMLCAVLFTIGGNAEHIVTIYEVHNPEIIEKRIFEILNEERKSRGLQPLVYNTDLAGLARIQSTNMLKHNFFSHTDQNGMNPQQRKVRYFPKLMGGVGENIAMHYGTSPEEVAVNLMKGWMNSPGHRANILKKSYSHVGVGITQKDAQYFYGTQVFADLIATLETEIPATVPFGSEFTLRFKFHGVFPKEQLTVFAHFPDRRARFYLPGGAFYIGNGPCTPVWDGEYFTVTLKLDKGKGGYSIRLGSNGSFYPDGVLIPVE
ncbi:MAG TPA: CAP domain-containing protein [Spirochaetota bacterium]|nr:CAP domain-containing protein [Spirochaetota bacterium]